MKLHGYYRSSTSYRLRIALNLKGLSYEQVPVNLLRGEQKDPAFVARNAYGSVPMLEVDGTARVQSMAILEWLDEAYPERPLLPRDIEARYAARELAYAIATELHAPLNLPVLRYLKDVLNQPQEAIDTYYRHILARTLDPLERRVAELGGDPFPFGEPGFFEAVLIPQLANARRFDFDLSPHPHLTAIEQACLALPAFRDAHPDNQPDNPQPTQPENPA